MKKLEINFNNLVLIEIFIVNVSVFLFLFVLECVCLFNLFFEFRIFLIFGCIGFLIKVMFM